jgi:hypothetical protein
MKELIQFNWKAFDTVTGTKFAIGVAILLLIENVTGASWITTALIALFAWLANVPGSLKDRIGGMIGFTLGAIFCTVLVFMIGPQLQLGIFALSVIGLLGTIAALWGSRSGMIGWAIIMYMLYAPSFVAGIGLENSLFAILIGVGVFFFLNVAGDVINTDRSSDPENAGEVGASSGYIAAYALIIAVALAVGTWMGQSIKTDPTMVAGTAFFVIGFDQRKTFIGGIARIIGITLGIFLGTLLVSQIGPGIALMVLLVAISFLTFATAPVHPSFLMFFLTLYFSAGWYGLQPDVLELTINEKLVGESAGIVIALISLALLQYWDRLRRSHDGSSTN